MVEVSQRRALVTLAIGSDSERKQDLLNSIQYEGVAQIFVVNLVSRLDSFGELEPGQRALVKLLQSAKDQYGIDKEPIFAELMQVLSASDVDSASASLAQLDPIQIADSKQRHVFVSYSRIDSDTMKRIRTDLRVANLVVWTDESIELGDPAWYGAIAKAIEEAFCVVVILSPDAKSSPWVDKEIEYAMNIHKRPVFPVMYRGDQQTSLPFLLAGTQWVDIQKDYLFGMKKVIAAIGSVTSRATVETKIDTNGGFKLGDYHLTETTWKQVADRVRSGLCTVFIGPDVNDRLMLPERELAQQWADKNDYPLPATDDLAMITHFLGLIDESPDHVKESLLAEWFATTSPQSFNSSNSAYEILAALPVHLYITTTYDDFMVSALKAQKREPTRLIYDDDESSWDGKKFDEQHPLVYHFYGHHEDPINAIIMEDDYLNYLTDFSRGDRAFPDWVQRRISSTVLMFVGFNVTHWNFRVLFRILTHLKYSRSPHVAVQIPMPSNGIDSEKLQRRVCEYLKKYFMQMKVHVYVGDTDDFLREMRRRVETKS